MTTPQNQLNNLAYQVSNLTEMFEVGDDEESIFERIERIDKDVALLTNRLEHIENQLALIIKLLSK